MKKIILFLLLTIKLISFAQTASKLTSKDSLMCNKMWILKSIELYGVASDPEELSKDDMIKLNYDKTYTLIVFGKKSSGTWTSDKTTTYITFTDTQKKEKMVYKIINASSSKCKIDYKNAEDDLHHILIFESK